MSSRWIYFFHGAIYHSSIALTVSNSYFQGDLQEHHLCPSTGGCACTHLSDMYCESVSFEPLPLLSTLKLIVQVNIINIINLIFN